MDFKEISLEEAGLSNKIAEEFLLELEKSGAGMDNVLRNTGNHIIKIKTIGCILLEKVLQQ